MNPTDHKQHENDKIDRWLDAVLMCYPDAEPRAGLEGRILAALETQRSYAAQRSWPWWGLAPAVATVIVIAAAISLTFRHPAPQPNVTQSAVSSAPAVRPAIPTRQLAPNPVVPGVWPAPRVHGSHSAPQKDAAYVIVSQTPAHLPQFPSPVAGSRNAFPALASGDQTQFPTPAPLSHQEQLLFALRDRSSPDQLADDAAMQERLRREVAEALESDGVPGPPGR